MQMNAGQILGPVKRPPRRCSSDERNCGSASCGADWHPREWGLPSRKWAEQTTSPKLPTNRRAFSRPLVSDLEHCWFFSLDGLQRQTRALARRSGRCVSS